MERQIQLRIHALVSDSVVDGPGLRLAVFTQGCFHNCPGCHNPMTHDPDGGRVCGIDEILTLLDENPLLCGITLTGGEPFLQPEGCLALAKAAKTRGKSVWAYSGYTLEELRGMGNPAVSELLDELDVLVDGRFVMEQRSLHLQYCGSANQRVIDMKKTKNDSVVLWSDPWAEIQIDC